MKDRRSYKVGEKIEVLANGQKIRAVAVPAVRDSDYCYYCCFFNYCRQFKGISDIGHRCYNTVFREEDS